ncbi:MAG: hydantoinase/oxoprolinase family protein [Gemmataceae bacterium]
MTRPVLGLDIGGANLKAAHTSGAARSVPFALWRDPGGLDAAIGRLVAEMPPFDALAVTMTGELCDCFASKREGVNHILDAVEGRAKTVKVWTNEGEFVDVPTARREVLKVASANWLALATFAGRYAPEGQALLIDMGTTTTDIVPLFNGAPVPRGRTDTERLESCELFYRGWKRTPLCVLGNLTHAAEFFATMHDVCLVLGLVPEDPADRDTADGRPATRADAERRLLRMISGDLETCNVRRRRALATECTFRFGAQMNDAVAEVIRTLPTEPEAFIVSGSGAFFLIDARPPSVRAQNVQNIVRLDWKLDKEISAAACAHAVAVLAREREG